MGVYKKQDWLRFFRNSIRPWVCWNSSRGLGVGLKFFGARADAVSTEAGLVISALGMSTSSWTASPTVLALDDGFLREPDVRGRLEVFLILLAGVTSTWSTGAASIIGDEVVVIVVVTLAFFVVNSSAMTMSVISPPSTAGELVCCSSTSVKSSSTKVPAAKARLATAHTILTPSQNI